MPTRAQRNHTRYYVLSANDIYPYLQLFRKNFACVITSSKLNTKLKSKKL